MEFQVPKFIERQPRIIWTITFRQFLFLAMVAGGLGILYLILPSKALFYLVAFLAITFSLSMVFIKIGGRPFSVVLVNFIRYLFGSRLYLWQRKAAPPVFLQKSEPIAKRRKSEIPETTLKITEKSRLKDMTRRVETGV